MSFFITRVQFSPFDTLVSHLQLNELDKKNSGLKKTLIVHFEENLIPEQQQKIKEAKKKELVTHIRFKNPVKNL